MTSQRRGSFVFQGSLPSPLMRAHLHGQLDRRPPIGPVGNGRLRTIDIQDIDGAFCESR